MRLDGGPVIMSPTMRMCVEALTSFKNQTNAAETCFAVVENPESRMHTVTSHSSDFLLSKTNIVYGSVSLLSFYLREVLGLTRWMLITCCFMRINTLKTSFCPGCPQIHVYSSLKGIACLGYVRGWEAALNGVVEGGVVVRRGISCRLIFQFLSWIVSDV
jgi:hypothetical protein